MKKNNAILVSAFPGTGKSYFFKNNKDYITLDSDSSKFNKDEFPENYIEHIKKNLNKVDIIFISSHKEVREALVENKLDFYLVYPDISLKKEYIQRYKERNNDDNFINLLNKNWNNWIKELEEQDGATHYVLKNGEFISNIFEKK